MAERGAGLAYCPSSNMILGDGIAGITEMRRLGVRIGRFNGRFSEILISRLRALGYADQARRPVRQGGVMADGEAIAVAPLLRSQVVREAQRVNADVVVLRGLDIEGLGTGLSGITVTIVVPAVSSVRDSVWLREVLTRPARVWPRCRLPANTGPT